MSCWRKCVVAFKRRNKARGCFMPKVSVVIPVYNVEDSFRRTLDSLVAQTLGDFEAICVNDCSTDASREILFSYVERDSRFRLIDNPVNRGPGPTRNVAIDAATGEYLYMLDSDDVISPDYLERMVAAAERNDAEIVLNLNMVRWWGDKESRYVHPTMSAVASEGEWIDRVRMLHDAPVCVPLRLYRREFIEKNQIRFLDEQKLDDEYFHRLVHVHNEKTFVFHGPEFRYQIRPEGVMSMIIGKDDRDYHMLRVFDVIYREYGKLGLLNRYPVKMFHVAPYFNVNSEEKFKAFRLFFEMIQEEHFMPMNHLYNALEKHFFSAIMEAKDFTDYKARHKSNVSVDFLLAKRKAS